MKYFKDCKSIEEAKKLYRQLLLKNHPDIAGKAGEAATVEIINQFNRFIDTFVADSFNAYYADKDEKPEPSTVTPFQEILKTIIDFDCDIEIIGYWIYCFRSYEVREALKGLGVLVFVKTQSMGFFRRRKNPILFKKIVR